MLIRVLLLVMLAAVAGPTTAEVFPAKPHLEVSAIGKVTAMPDVVRISTDHEAVSMDVDAARAEVEAEVSRVISAAEALGLQGTQIRADRLSVDPDYRWDDGEPHLIGYKVSRSVRLRLEDIDRYAELVDALIAAGVTRLGNVAFDLSNRRELEIEARRRAFQNARTTAAAMAADMDVALLKPWRITLGAPSSGTDDAAMFMGLEMTGSAMSAAPAPMLLDEETVEAAVTVIFLIK